MNVKVWKEENNGIRYVNVRSEELVDAVVSLNEQRITMKGYPSVTLMTGSPIHGDQVQFQLHQKNEEQKNHPAIIEKRNVRNYQRVEIYVPLAVGLEMLRLALKERYVQTGEINLAEFL